TAAATQGPLLSNAGTQEAVNLQAPSSAPAGVARQKIVPISVFVSRKSSKLFVRRGFAPLFDVPVKIQNPEQPLGTHVFTAMEPQAVGSAVRWMVVSISERSTSDSSRGRKTPKERSVETTSSAPLSDNANTALDRLD